MPSLLNVISGKNYRKNVLLGDTLIALNKKSREATENPFVRNWTLLCTTSIGIFLEKLIWNELEPRDQIGSINLFYKNLKQLNKDKVTSAIRALVFQYLMWFLSNDSNVAELDRNGFTTRTFQQRLFDFYSHTPEEVNFFRKELEGQESTAASSRLWSYMVTNVLGESANDYPQGRIAFETMALGVMVGYYKTFIETLDESA